jgi:hypothetical protein
MRTILLIIFLAGYCSILFAEENSKRRGSSLELKSEIGKDSLNALSVYSFLGATKSTGVTLLYQKLKRENDYKSTEFQVGLDTIFNSSFSMFLTVGRRKEPGEIVGTGGELGFSLIPSDIWDAQKATILKLAYQIINWRRAMTLRARRLSQRAYTVGVMQEVLRSLTVSLNYKKFKYSTDPQELEQLSMYYNSETYMHIMNLIPSFLDYSLSFDLNWNVTKRFLFGSFLSKMKSKLDSISTTTVGVFSSYEFYKDLIFTVSPSRSKSSDGYKSWSCGFSLQFLF